MNPQTSSIVGVFTRLRQNRDAAGCLCYDSQFKDPSAAPCGTSLGALNELDRVSPAKRLIFSLFGYLVNGLTDVEKVEIR